MRGPTANIYGSGAIGGVVSFRTKDIEDVVRPGERWGVDIDGIVGTNKDRGSRFGVRRRSRQSRMSMCSAARSTATRPTTRTAPAPRSAIPATEIPAGLVKLTVRPADGHEVKLGGIFQEDHYNIGQPTAARRPRRPPPRPGSSRRTSIYNSDVKNYTGTISWKYSKPGRQVVRLGRAISTGNRTENNQVKTVHTSATPTGVLRSGGIRQHISGCVGDKRGYLLDTIGIDVYNTSRFDTGDWRNAVTYGLDAFQDKVTTSDTRGNSNVTTPGGQRTVSGGFVQLKSNYFDLARGGRRAPLRPV